MGTAADTAPDRALRSPERAAELIDALAQQQRVLARAQARQAELMVEFAAVRQAADARRIGDLADQGRDARYEPGEFACIEIALAVRVNRHSVRSVMAVARRLQAETPDAYDAWLAGEIDQPRAVKINHALLRLTKESSKQLLNATVVDVAVCKTVELLGRWLNQFVAMVEPDETDERLRRSLEDRYVSVRPDLDGISFLSAAVSSVNAAAVDQVLTALAAAAAPDDPRTLQQRRADALVDVLLGRISNGCHVHWVDGPDGTGNDVNDDHPDGGRCHCDGGCNGDSGVDRPRAANDLQSHTGGDDDSVSHASGAEDDVCDYPSRADDDELDHTSRAEDDHDDSADGVEPGLAPDCRDAKVPDSAGDGEFFGDGPGDGPDDGWEQPASVYRPDPRPAESPADDPEPLEPAPGPDSTGEPIEPERPDTRGGGRVVVTPCAGNHQSNPIPAVIGVIVSAQSLFGFSNAPGQLIDRSALVPADTIRALAQQPGTLFHRLITDEKGRLLDVTELGRFPSRKLGLAVQFRDGVCIGPACHTPASHCDLDHITPVPEGPTTGTNLGPECRCEHRAKTHAGHQVARIDPDTTAWTTPTGHRYLKQSPPLPVENWPLHTVGRAPCPTPVPNPTTAMARVLSPTPVAPAASRTTPVASMPSPTNTVAHETRC